MNRLRSLSRTHSAAFAWLFALALMMRLLVPAGWMPSAQDGRWISICSASGATMVWIDADGKVHSDGNDEEQHKDKSCVFAGLSLAMDFLAHLALSSIIAPLAALAPMLRDLLPGRGLAAPPPPKTGPPILN